MPTLEDELRQLREEHRLLLNELQHRVRNNLAVIRSIARRTGEHSQTAEDFSLHLDGRLGAFARSQAASMRDPAGVDLRSIVTEELAAMASREGDRLRIDGPDVSLRTKPAETLALAFHELATNAVKFGALADGSGSVRIAWSSHANGVGERLVITWVEHMPGQLDRPTHSGFGVDLLECTLAYELDAETELAFTPSGLHCSISLPATDRIIVHAGKAPATDGVAAD